jgi:ribosomal protein S18 acetylase RimI-like enzyme
VLKSFTIGMTPADPRTWICLAAVCRSALLQRLPRKKLALVAKVEDLLASPDEIVIRDATASDEARADRLVRGIFPDDPHTYAANILLPNECINVVAVSPQAGVIGFTSLLLDATPLSGTQDWRKYSLYTGVIVVDPEYRRCGIGTQRLSLLARAALIRRPQYNWLYLHVRQDREAAVKCFEKFGFERAGEAAPDKFGNRSWLMRRNIHHDPR